MEYICFIASSSIPDSCVTHMGAPPEQFQGGAEASPGQYKFGHFGSLAARSHPKPHQCDFKATPMRVDSQLIATLKPP
jgi:hypothetical protein